MASTPEESKTESIVLPSRLTISELAEWHQSILETVAGASALTIEAGSVERIDTAGLQCLTALVETARTRGQPLTWNDVSPEVISGAERLGLACALGLPTADPTEENR